MLNVSFRVRFKVWFGVRFKVKVKSRNRITDQGQILSEVLGSGLDLE